jgi:prepilin-type N-terminal cleavage/methylation domain-containing protein
MKTKQTGFTLIELVVVIVLLGIVGAVATAKFQNMSLQARNAVIQGVSAELSSAAVINFASSRAGGAFTPLIAGGGAAPDCDTATMGLLLQAGWPAGYTVAIGAGACGTPGNSFTCTISHTDAGVTSRTATLLCTG